MPRLKAIVSLALKGYGKDNCSSFAAAIAYYTLLSIFPLTVVAVSLTGYVLRNDPSGQERIINTLMKNLPLSQTEGRSQLYDTLTAVTSGRAGLGILGVLGAL